MDVRVEAFNALGKLGTTSEIVLLQTLSKKVLGATKEKKFHCLGAAECFKISASAVAGTFVHGLEDEFYKDVLIVGSGKQFSPVVSLA